MVKPGYKQSEVGVIPEDWDVKPLNAVLKKGRLGGNYPNQDANTGLPLMKMGNLARGTFDISKIQFIQPGIKPSPEHKLEIGDVLFNTRNTLDLVGKVAMWRGELPCAYYNSNLLRFEFDANHIYSNAYANLTLNTKGSVSRLRALATGTTSVSAIYTRDLLNFLVAVPPLPEQQAIATALSDADELIGSFEQLLTKKRQIKQGAMQELLTGKKRLPGFSVEWEVKRLGDVGKCLRGVGYRGDSDLSTHDTIHTKRLLRSNNVQNAIILTDEVQFVNAVRVSAHQILKRNDILLCMANGSKALVGKAGFFTVCDGCDYTFGAFMGCFRTDTTEAVSAFIFSLFQTGRYRDYINNLLAGSSINNLRPSSIESLEFSMPAIPEQTAIAEVLSDMDSEIEALETKLAKARQVKQGMMQELLTGRIRIV